MSEILKRHNVVVTGQGSRAMIFAHGFGCDQNMWRMVAPAFESKFRVVLFDYLGHGKSDARQWSAERYNTLDSYADDVLAICEALQIHDAIFVGHSVSAMIGILAQEKDPSRIGELVLVGPSPRYVNDADYVGGFSRADIDGLLDFMDSNYLGWSSNLAPVIMANQDKPELSKELENSFCRTDPTIAKHFGRLTFLSDNRGDLAGVSCPTLILQCQNDAIAPVSVGEYVHQRIPDSVLKILPSHGHCPHLSSPAMTIAAMSAFLDGERAREVTGT